MIEVKACGHAKGQLRFFLTRNEWDTALRHPDSWLVHFWRVADIRSKQVQTPHRVVLVSELVSSVPVDVGIEGRWTECVIHLPE